jgi:hypothetical protein
MSKSITIVLSVSILFISSCLFAQHNQTLDSLSRVLEDIHSNDQLPRQQLDSIEKRFGYNSEEVSNQWKLISYSDSVNSAVVSQIIDKYGWLGTDQISDLANKTLFLVIQHASDDTQIKYLDTLKNAARTGRAKPSYYALLLDRTNMNRGKFQEYGSQLSMDGAGKWTFFPIRDEPNVNKRRLLIGLPAMEEYAKKFEVTYILPEHDEYRNRFVLTGYLTDTLGIPIPGVSIFNGKKLLGITGSDGSYKIALRKRIKKLEMKFVKTGYQEIEYEFIRDTTKDVYFQPIILSQNVSSQIGP